MPTKLDPELRSVLIGAAVSIGLVVSLAVLGIVLMAVAGEGVTS